MADITIIGGGTAGLFLARELKEKKISSIVYEEHKELGKPIHDTGIISKNIDEFFKDCGKISLNVAKGAKLYSPGGKVVELTRKGDEAYILDRDKLEKELSKGISVELGKKIESLDFKSKYIIGADGVNSTVAKLANFPKITEHLTGLQYEIENTYGYEKDFVEIYFGNKVAPGFFAWVVPTKKTLRIGLATEKTASEAKLPRISNEMRDSCKTVFSLCKRTKFFYTQKTSGFLLRSKMAKQFLDDFIKEKFEKFEILSTIGGLIPIKFREQIVKDNIALVGDAAGQVKPATGGGVYMGMASARILANAIKRNDMKSYENEWNQKIKPELEHGAKIRNFLKNSSDSEIDKVFNLLQDEKIKNLILEHGDMDKPSKLLKAALKNPKLILEFAPYLKYLW